MSQTLLIRYLGLNLKAFESRETRAWDLGRDLPERVFRGLTGRSRLASEGFRGFIRPRAMLTCDYTKGESVPAPVKRVSHTDPEPETRQL